MMEYKDGSLKENVPFDLPCMAGAISYLLSNYGTPSCTLGRGIRAGADWYLLCVLSLLPPL